MSVVVSPMFWVVGMMMGYIIGVEYTGSSLIGFITAAVGGVAFGLFHWYSPIPNHNGGWGMPPARLQKWGFTNEPRHDDYEDPTTEQVMSAAVPTGWSFAKRKDGGDD